MSKIPTVKEFLDDSEIFETIKLKQNIVKEPTFLYDDVQKAMVEFTKLHVEAALKEASEKAYARGKGSSLTTKSANFFYTFAGHIGEIEMNKNSILNAYPLENIK